MTLWAIVLGVWVLAAVVTAVVLGKALRHADERETALSRRTAEQEAAPALQ